ncbi:MAG: DUF3800 domain-containing protein [Candidatus Nanopelagicales bacterium]
MADHYLYLDETGTLDFESRPGEAYFGVGTAHFAGDHRDAIWAGHQLPVNLEASGIRLPKGLHAKDDSHPTRAEVYSVLAEQPVRFDATLLRKEKAYDIVQRAGKVRLYKLAVWMHLKYVIPRVASRSDRVFMVAGRLQTSSHRDAIRHAVDDVCAPVGFEQEVIPCIWEAQSSWGIQAADYALWRIQRVAEGKRVPDYTDKIEDQVDTTYYAWGQ